MLQQTQIVWFVKVSDVITLDVNFYLYGLTIKGLGTTEYHMKLLKDLCDLKYFGCFAMTELSHGSNVQGVETTATYDVASKSFILQTPHEWAMKYWIGNLGKTAQRAVVFAQLITKNVNYGVHIFITDIRDSTHETYPGIEIGDIGHKIGCDGIDNGWMMFNQYKVPKENLLNWYANVTDEGEYHSEIKSDNKRFAWHMAALSAGRHGCA